MGLGNLAAQASYCLSLQSQARIERPTSIIQFEIYSGARENPASIAKNLVSAARRWLLGLPACPRPLVLTMESDEWASLF
jgi:hypothetical protein